MSSNQEVLAARQNLAEEFHGILDANELVLHTVEGGGQLQAQFGASILEAVMSARPDFTLPIAQEFMDEAAEGDRFAALVVATQSDSTPVAVTWRRQFVESDLEGGPADALQIITELQQRDGVPDDKLGYASHFGVRAEHQGKGIGVRLAAAALTFLAPDSATIFRLRQDPSRAAAATVSQKIGAQLMWTQSNGKGAFWLPTN